MPSSRVRVLFVCMGNICRSPMAAAVLREELERAGLRDVTVASAGTGGWHVGDPADRRAQAALARKGYRTDHAAQQFRTEWFDEYDVIVAMDRDNVSELRRLAPSKGHTETLRLLLEFHPDAETLDVPDPYYGAASDFDDVLEMIEVACGGLLEHLKSPVKDNAVGGWPPTTAPTA